MKNMKKILVLALAAVLLVAVSVGGTVAYLTAVTDEVENTFMPAGIEITLDETKKSDGTEVAAGVTDWTAKMIPGATYPKNPKVTLTKADCDVYIFITVADNTDGAVSYEVDAGDANSGKWIKLQDGVWYREAATTDVNTSWDILKGNKVTIPTTLGENDMPEANVTIVFDAYAVQKSIGTADQAWAQVKPAAGN